MQSVYKLLCLLLSMLLLFPALTVCAVNESGSLGDINGDGSLDAKDYMILKRYILGTYELDWHARYRADINLDGIVYAKDYLQFKRIILGTFNFPQIDSVADINLLSDSELKKYFNAQLACKRAEGEILVFFEDHTELQTAAETFASIGLPADLSDKSIYLYCSAEDEVLQFEKLWFKICVPESEMRDMMFELQRTSSVSSVSPNYIGSWA